LFRGKPFLCRIKICRGRRTLHRPASATSSTHTHAHTHTAKGTGERHTIHLMLTSPYKDGIPTVRAHLRKTVALRKLLVYHALEIHESCIELQWSQKCQWGGMHSKKFLPWFPEIVIHPIAISLSALHFTRKTPSSFSSVGP